MMKRMVMFTALAVIGFGLHAANVTCIRCTYGSSPQDAANWDNNKVPELANDYFVTSATYLLDSGNTGDITFTGGSLTVGKDPSGGHSKSGFVFIGKQGMGTTYFPCGIDIYDACGSTINITKGNGRRIDGEIRLHSDLCATTQLLAGFRSCDQTLEFSGAIVGDETTGMIFYSNSADNKNTNDFVVFTGDLSSYKGVIDSQWSGAGQVCSFAFGSVTFPGTMKMTQGKNVAIRTATVDDVANIANLTMPDGAILYPQLDLQLGKCGRINVTKALTASGTHPVCVDFISEFTSCSHEAKSYAVLSAVGENVFDEEDFEIVPMNAGELPADALVLRVENENGVTVLYLDVAEYSSGEVTVAALSKSDAPGESAFLPEFASHWNPVGVPQEGRTYSVSGGHILYTPYHAAASGLGEYAFGGDALVLGDETSVGKLFNQSYARIGIQKLVISNGYYGAASSFSGNRHSWLVADIEICAHDFEKALFATEQTWQHVYLEGCLTGAAEAKMCFRNTKTTVVDFGIGGDASGYLGEVLVMSTQPTVSPNFYLSSTQFPGKLILGQTVDDENEGGISLYCTNATTISKLAVNRPSSIPIVVDCVTFTKTTPIITVTDALDLRALVQIPVTVTGGDPIVRKDNLDAAFIPVIRWPKNLTDVDESKFVMGACSGIVNTPQVGYFTIEVRDEGEYRVAGVAKRKMHYLVESDGGTAASCSFEHESGGTGWNWDNHSAPDFDCDYFVGDYLTLRTLWGAKEEYFQGRQLFLMAGLVIQSDSATVTNLSLTGGSVYHYHAGGDKTVNTDLAPGGTRHLRGSAVVETRGGKFGAPRISPAGCFEIDADLSGAGLLKLVLNGGETGMMGYLDLAGDNSKFGGKIAAESATADAWGEMEHLNILFSAAKNLGGDFAEFAYDGISLRHYSVLKPLGSVLLDRENRGIYIDGFGGVDVASGETLTIMAPVTYHGAFVKFGEGNLFLCAQPMFLQAGNVVGENPESGNNVLEVRSGAVGVSSNPLSLDGVRIKMSEKGGLCVKVGDVATTGAGAFGLKNVKESVPFDLTGNGGKLKVSFDVSDQNIGKDDEYVVSICTVGQSAADGLEGNIVLKRPRGRTVTLLDPVKNPDNTTTFRAFVGGAPGLAIIVR